MPIEFKLFGKVTDVRREDPWKASSSITVTELGIITVVSWLDINVSRLIVVKELGSVIEVRVEYAKANSPIEETVFGIEIVVSEVPKKASSPIETSCEVS